jgi:hypothetical protein
VSDIEVEAGDQAIAVGDRKEENICRSVSDLASSKECCWYASRRTNENTAAVERDPNTTPPRRLDPQQEKTPGDGAS